MPVARKVIRLEGTASDQDAQSFTARLPRGSEKYEVSLVRKDPRPRYCHGAIVEGEGSVSEKRMLVLSRREAPKTHISDEASDDAKSTTSCLEALVASVVESAKHGKGESQDKQEHDERNR